jgi:hypothetical protein
MANSYPLHRRRFAIAAKEESTYGTENAPAFTADAFRVLEVPTVSLGALSMNERDNWVTGGLGGLRGAGGSGLLHTISGPAVFIGPGVAYDDATVWPNVHALLLTAFSATVDTTPSSESVTYDISDSPDTGLTVYTNFDGKQFQTLGAVLSSLVIEGEAGKWPTWTFELMGIHDSIAEADYPATVTYKSALPPLMANIAMTIGSYSPVIRSFSLDLGLEVALRGDGNAVNAHQGYRIVKRTPRLTATVEVDDAANYNPWDDFQNATARTIDLTIGGTQYNRFAIDIDEAAVAEPPSSVDLDGLSGAEVVYGIHTPSSGNELTIVAD